MKIFSRETLPRIFQTFNSLYSSMTRKRNASIVAPSRQLVGEYPPVSFERLFQYYQNWAQIKRSMDTTHQKFMGAGIQIKSDNPQFQQFINYWWAEVNAQKKFAEFFLNLFITGNGMMEIQYTPEGQIGNIESIPMWTIWRIFRDQFANEIKIVQLIDGVFKELDPQFYIHYMINNPEREAFGKSEFFAVANPRPVNAEVDPTTGQPTNPARVLTPTLDAQAILQDAEIEIKKKMAKPKIFVKAPGMGKDDMAKLRAELEDPSSAQYVWVIDSTEIDIAEAKIDSNGKFEQYGINVDSQIDISTGYASKTVTDPGGFSYSSSQTPFDSLDQRMVDLQAGGTEMIKDRLIRALAESWGFTDFDDLNVEVSFMPSVRRLSMEDIQKLPVDAVCPEEKREILKKLHIPLDDKLWDEYSKKQDDLKQQQMDALHKQAENGMMGQGDNKGGYSQKSPVSPIDNKPEKMPFESDRPKPESLKEVLKLAIKEVLAEERINLNPNNDDSSTYNDLYVGQGLDESGKPIITDPKLAKKFQEHPNELPGGLYEQEEEDDPALEDDHLPEGANIKTEDQHNMDKQNMEQEDPEQDKGIGDYKDIYGDQNNPKEDETGLPDGMKKTHQGPREDMDEQPVMPTDTDPVRDNVKHTLDDQEKPAQLNKDFAGPQKGLVNTDESPQIGNKDKSKTLVPKPTDQKPSNINPEDKNVDKSKMPPKEGGKPHPFEKKQDNGQEKPKKEGDMKNTDPTIKTSKGTNDKGLPKEIIIIKKGGDKIKPTDKDKPFNKDSKEDIAGPPASANMSSNGIKPKKKKEDNENE